MYSGSTEEVTVIENLRFFLSIAIANAALHFKAKNPKNSTKIRCFPRTRTQSGFCGF